MLADAEVHVPRGVVRRREVLPRLDRRVVRRREIGRSAHQLGQEVRRGVENRTERGPAGDTPVLLGECWDLLLPALRTLTGQSPLDLLRLLRMCAGVRRPPGVPLGMSVRAARLGLPPVRQRFLGYEEWLGAWPAQVLLR